VLGLDSKILTAGEVRERFFDSTEQYGAAQIRPTFALNPLSFTRGLAEAAERHGARLHGHSEVLKWRRENGVHVLETAKGSLRARRVIIATNGFAVEHLSKDIAGRPLPVISAMVVTRPLTGNELAARHWQTHNPIITARILLNYFRLLPDNRLLFGGRGHSKGDAPGANKTFVQIQKKLGELWPELKDIQVDYRWHGLICYTRDRRPAIGQLEGDSSVLYGWGFHGNGVNTATWAGKQLAAWAGQAPVGQEGAPIKLPEVVKGLPGRFPFPGLRRRYLQGALTWYRLMDWLH
jgi:glycine/D-amino acid oxidase-like deaminating enzyme